MRGFKAVLFDCDGVLADSEHLVDRVLAEDLTARGWVLTPEESGAVFLGMALPDMAPVVKAKLGHLPPDWTEQLKRKVTETMAREVPPVPGAEALLQRLRRSPLPLALASNSSRLELSAKLGRLGFAPFFGDRIFSFEDVARPKPHPDIYLAAAAACGTVSPLASCAASALARVQPVPWVCRLSWRGARSQCSALPSVSRSTASPAPASR